MTLSEFDRRLKLINSSLQVRIRGPLDVGGIFLGTRYLIRLSKGELNLNGYSIDIYQPDELGSQLGISMPPKKITSRIMKRGRKTLVNMLNKHIPLTLKQRASLLYGV